MQTIQLERMIQQPLDIETIARLKIPSSNLVADLRQAMTLDLPFVVQSRRSGRQLVLGLPPRASRAITCFVALLV